MSDTIAVVRDIVADTLAIPLEQVTPRANIIDDLGADSLDVVEMVIRAEERWRIKVPDRDLSTIETAQGFADLLDCLMAETAGARR